MRSSRINKFNEMLDPSQLYPDKITLSPAQLRVFSRNEEHPNFPGLEFDYDTSKGDFDSEKGAVYDFEVYLYDSVTKRRYIGYGGWYHQGISWDRSITFELQDPPETWKTIRAKIPGGINPLDWLEKHYRVPEKR